MKITKTRIFACIGAAIWLAAVVLASIYDLDISRAIVDESSRFGLLLEAAGEPPAILFASFNLALMAAYFCKCAPRTKRSMLLLVLTLVGCVGTSVFTMIKVANYIYSYMGFSEVHLLHLIYAVVLALAVSFIFAMIAVFLNEEALEKYFHIAWRCVLAAILTFAIIWAFKLVWGRVRPRQLEECGGFTSFTPWYLPQGFTGYFSFPSGHTANATVILSSLYYLRFLPQKFRVLKPITITLLAVWLVLVALSRVVVGAHYLSDVLFGAAITLGIVYFARPKEE